MFSEMVFQTLDLYPGTYKIFLLYVYLVVF